MEFLNRTWAEIDLSALVHNLQIIKKLIPSKRIMAVIKADAYGHSVKYVAPVLQNAGADFFAVSNIDEAIQLRKNGITKDILVLGYTPIDCVKDIFEYDIIQAVYSKDYACELSAAAVRENVKLRVHIKLDTGMGRIGFDCRSEEISGIDDAILSAKLSGFAFEGIFTHFADADNINELQDGFTDRQYSRFLSATKSFKLAGLEPKFCHCSNSAATLLHKNKSLDICRTGIILYGLTPLSDLNLSEYLIPVMTFKSVISMVKEISAGDTVNYGRTFTADKNMKVATVTAGYADGYPRQLSNKAYVYVNGKRAKVIGRVCMDQLSIDVSHINNIKLGDEVELFGKNVTATELADIIGTINYEIVCGISHRVPRVAVNGEEKQ